MTNNWLVVLVLAGLLVAAPAFTANADADAAANDALLRRATRAYGAESASESQIVGMFQTLSDRGDMRGTMWLARCHAEGRCGLRKNAGLGQQLAESALPGIKRLAEGGDAEAQFLLADCFHEGIGVDVDYGQALKWYRLAVKQDQINTFVNLGVLLADGTGTEPDIEEARRLFARGAKLGSMLAAVNVELYKKPDAKRLARLRELKRNKLAAALAKQKAEAVRILVANRVISSPDNYVDYIDNGAPCLNFEDDGIVFRMNDGIRVDVIDAYRGRTESDQARGGIPFGIEWDDGIEQIQAKLGKYDGRNYDQKQEATGLTFSLGNVYFTLFAEPKGTMKLWRIREYWREDFPGEE